MTDSKPSCIAFREPLLRVLSELSEGVANVPVEMTRTYHPVCVLLDIAEDKFGYSSHGTLWTHRQIGLAMRALKKGGYTDQKKKAQWEITELGLRLLMEGTEGLSSLPEDDDEGDLSSNVIHLPMMKSLYDEDAYLRSVAVEHTECFGSYSSRSDVCGGCLLASFCIHALDARLAELAEELEVEEAKLRASTRAQQKTRENQDASINELLELDDPTPPAAAARAVSQSGSASRELICGTCKKPIRKGDACEWYVDAGVACHKGCPPPEAKK